jgi:hypothetical protein
MKHKFTFNWSVQEQFYCSTTTLDSVYRGNTKDRILLRCREVPFCTWSIVHRDYTIFLQNKSFQVSVSDTCRRKKPVDFQRLLLAKIKLFHTREKFFSDSYIFLASKRMDGGQNDYNERSGGDVPNKTT